MFPVVIIFWSQNYCFMQFTVRNSTFFFYEYSNVFEVCGSVCCKI